MGRNRRHKAPETRKSVGEREREWMVRGFIAASASATFVAAIYAAMSFPFWALIVAIVLFCIASLAAQALALSRDVDWYGELREAE